MILENLFARAHAEHVHQGRRDDLSAVPLDPDCRAAGLGSQAGLEAASAWNLRSRHQYGGIHRPAGRRTKEHRMDSERNTPTGTAELEATPASTVVGFFLALIFLLQGRSSD